MSVLRLDRMLETFQSTEFILGLLWAGLAAITVTLLVMMLTRWGQYQPVRKSLALSLLAHLLFAGYATTVQITSATPPPKDDPIRVAIGEQRPDKDLAATDRAKREKPWEAFVEEPAVQPDPVEMARMNPQELRTPERQSQSPEPGWTIAPSLDHLSLANASQAEPKAMPAEVAKKTHREAKEAEPIEAPKAQRREAVRAEVPVQPDVQRKGFADNSLSDAVRRSHAGLPSELLERPVRMPRLDDAYATTEKPADLLAGDTNPQSFAHRGKPADLYASSAPPTGMPEGTTEPKGDTRGPEAEQLHPPSIAARGGLTGAGRDALASLGAGGPRVTEPLLPTPHRSQADHQVPEAYKLRMAPDRPRVAQQQGASSESERAVKLALKWLAANQEPDGRWNARRHGGGYETKTAGRDREGAGARADTAMTGLSLLAFLASGHTHQGGEYNASVRQGLTYLIRVQRSDGGLGGNAANFEYNYCHAMATLALSEAYGMTGDPALEGPVRRAVAYTLANQNATTGGWRYNPWDDGDTSMLGWHWMALKSAELAGIPIPEKTREGVIRFLSTVSSGAHGGLASYRRGEAATRPMTAEALLVRQLLGISNDTPTAREASRYVLEQLPGQGEDNVYYWYYATLAMYQMQGPYWDQWNEALQRRLVSTQRTDGALAGTWDPDRIWGGYGGRIYSTALSALSLEVYYRYLPLYLQADPSEPISR
jgi:hypothetical protein